MIPSIEIEGHISGLDTIVEYADLDGEDRDEVEDLADKAKTHMIKIQEILESSGQ